MAFDIKINLDWRTILVIVIAFFVYKIGLAIFDYSKKVVPTIFGYIVEEIINIISDPFVIFLLIFLGLQIYIEKMKKY